MTLAISEAESILGTRLGPPAKPATQYVIGFRTPSGKVLAIDRRAAETRVWFEPPEPPDIDGVQLMERPSNGNSNLDGPLQPLRDNSTLRVEISSSGALDRFLDWYLEESTPVAAKPLDTLPAPRDFDGAFRRFQGLMKAKSGHPFRGFDEGLAAVWESYKPRLREHALSLLNAGAWTEGEIGSGAIIERTVAAIEIQDGGLNLTNNLVFWQNRYGRANCEHLVLLETATDPKLRSEIEALLFGLYRGDADEQATFERLSALSKGKYPLLAYLFFLKDMNRFMPIQPTGFDRAFRALEIDFSTLRQCSWENYSTYLAVLDSLRPRIAAAAKLADVRLVDAHSFCWILASLLKQEAEGTIARTPGSKDAGRVLGAREKAIVAMRMSVENTVRNSNGQVVERTLKDKELRMSALELQGLIASLMDIQENRCALTGIPFQYPAPGSDRNLHPSVDRIDSDGHYEQGNIQIVCQFVNFWKSDTDNDEFIRLLMLVRDVQREV